MKIYTENKWLAFRDHAKLASGFCPNCESRDLVAGPRGGLARNVLCLSCRVEFNVGPAAAQVIAEQCPVERMREIYGVEVKEVKA